MASPKLMLVDDILGLFGSANIDTRSFLLNFEFNVECYDQGLVAEMNSLVDTKLKNAHQVTLQEIRNRRLPDQIARRGCPALFTLSVKYNNINYATSRRK